MKKALFALPVLMLFTTALFAQSNCGISPVMDITPAPICICDNASTTPPVLTVSSDLSNTEYLIIDLNQMGAYGLGPAIVGIDDDGVFLPADLGLTGNLDLAIVPISYNIQNFRDVIDGVFNNMYLGKTCCAHIEFLIDGFCAAMIAKGLTNTANINSLVDIVRILDYVDATNGTYSIPKLVSKFVLLQNLIKAAPDECLEPMSVCYAVGVNQQLYTIKESPMIGNVVGTGNFQITVDASVTSGTLEYSTDPSMGWQSSNVLNNVTPSGIVYVRNTATQCITSFPYETADLPVELSDFKGRTSGNTNILKWTTKTEQDNLGFTVLRSDDGVNFEKLDWIYGAGNSLSERNYTYSDNAPLTGKNYYQLSMQDFDGGRTVSDVIVVNRTERTGFGVISISNANHDAIQLSISNDQPGNMEYLVHDMNGRNVITGTQELQTGINNLSIDVSDLEASVYIFTATKNGLQVIGRKFIVY